MVTQPQRLVDAVNRRTEMQLTSNDEPEKVYEYTCTLMRPDGSTYNEVLVGVSDEHAHEEAMHEFEHICIAVKRGEFLYNND